MGSLTTPGVCVSRLILKANINHDKK